jgi:hypothetical protein
MPGMVARKRDSERIRDAGRNPALPPKGQEAHTQRVSWEQHDFLNAPVAVPKPDKDWHPVARAWFESLAQSGQHVFYEPSDWQTAWLLAESISRDLRPQFVGVTHPAPGTGESSEPIYEPIPMRGASLTAYVKAMSGLMVTEGQRRQFRVEVERHRVNDVIAPTLYLAATRDEAFDEAQ